MALFDRFKKPKAATKSIQKAAVQGAPFSRKEQKPKTEAAPAKLAAERSEETKAADIVSARYAGILLKPHVSEKAAMLADQGVYVFDVPVSANKVEIRKAVESVYRVDVSIVRTQRGAGKRVARGRIAGQRNAWKKALVKLKKGHTINLVEGV